MTDYNLLLKVLKSELTKTKADLELDAESAENVFNIATKHDLAYAAAHFFNVNSYKTEKTEKAEMLGFYRFEQQKFALNQIKDIFNREDIPFIPLKGSVIRDYYDNPLLRSSCDIDILIKSEDLIRAEEKLCEAGYKKEIENFHDVSFVSPNNVKIELHFSLLEGEAQIDSLLQKPWDYALPKEKSEFKFTDDYFVFYFYAHAYHHFLTGGCGVKTIMDIFVLENKAELKIECAKDLLTQAEIYKFAVGLKKLCDCWFGGLEETEQTKMLGVYIINGGVYGNRENFLKVYNSRIKNSFNHLFRVIFPPIKKIKNRYKVHTALAPFYYPVYWINGFNRHVLNPSEKNDNYCLDNLLKDLGIIKKQ